MNNCKYCKNEISDGILHEISSNKELKKLNNSENTDIPCMRIQGCGKYEENINSNKETEK